MLAPTAFFVDHGDGDVPPKYVLQIRMMKAPDFRGGLPRLHPLVASKRGAGGDLWRRKDIMIRFKSGSTGRCPRGQTFRRMGWPSPSRLRGETAVRGCRAVRAERLSEMVAGTIGRRIVSGKYMPGETLPTEPKIQQEFGVSRTAVREAIRLLSAKGLTVVAAEDRHTSPPDGRLEHARPGRAALADRPESDRGIHPRALRDARDHRAGGVVAGGGAGDRRTRSPRSAWRWTASRTRRAAARSRSRPTSSSTWSSSKRRAIRCCARSAR